MMPFTCLAVLMLVLAPASAGATEPPELVTGPDAVLCLRADSLAEANAGHAANSQEKYQERLRGLGCMRSPAGIPATLLDGSDAAGSWSVRLRPAGISGGITMWGRSSAFTLPDGTPLRSRRAEK